MSKQHKWHKEICAWASGAEIEYASHDKEDWELTHDNNPSWGNIFRYRIKPQPKEPTYLYVYGWPENGHISFCVKPGYPYIGKIELLGE